MPYEAGSLEDVQAWAKSELSDYLENVPQNDLHTIQVDGEFADGKVILQATMVTVLHVGSLNTWKMQTIYARITGKSDVGLVSEEIDSPTSSSTVVRYLRPVVDLRDVVFTEPFSWVTQTQKPAALDRVEALIRYMFLKGGEKLAVQPRLLFFKMHFRAACRDAHNGMHRIVEDEDPNDIETLPDDSSPDFVEDQAATTIFNDHAHAMDESYHNFKTSVLQQLGTVRDIDREDMAQLQAQNKDLERRLAVSEQSRAELDKELDKERAKSRNALEEAERWKTQLERLKNTLQGALGQRF